MSTSLWPDSSTEFFWVGPLAVVIMSFIFWRAGQMVTTKVSFDVLQNCDVDCMKEAVKNSWTNMAVTAALLLTLVVAMLQLDPMGPVGFEIDDVVLEHVQQTYIALCIGAMFFNLLSIFYSIIYLSFVDPLRNIDVMKFLVTFPDSIGDPAIWLAEGCIFMWLAIALWVFGTYGAHQLVTAIGFFIAFCMFIAFQARTRGSFNPDDLDFSWTQEDPSTWKRGYLTRHIAETEGISKKVQKLGKLIVESEVHSEDASRRLAAANA